MKGISKLMTQFHTISEYIRANKHNEVKKTSNKECCLSLNVKKTFEIHYKSVPMQVPSDFLWELLSRLYLSHFPLNLFVRAPVQALSLSLYAYLMLEANKINPSAFSIPLSLGCRIGCTRRERVPLGTISQSPESETLIKILSSPCKVNKVVLEP